MEPTVALKQKGAISKFRTIFWWSRNPSKSLFTSDIPLRKEEERAFVEVEGGRINEAILPKWSRFAKIEIP